MIAPPEPASQRPWAPTLALVWLGQTVSNIGDSFFFVGVVFLALQAGASKGAAGSLIALNYVPALALGLVAGAFVDRRDRLRVLVGCDLFRAAVVGAVALLAHGGHLRAGGLAAGVLALATGTTLFNPALKALIPERVPRHRLTLAATLFQFSLYAAYVVGPFLAALLVPRRGLVPLFALDAASFLVSAACFGVVALVSPARRTRPAARPLGADIAAVVRAIGRDPLLRGLLVITAAESLVIMGPAYVAMPLLVRDRLGLGAGGYASAQMAFFLGVLAAAAGAGLLTRWFARGLLMLVGIALDALTFVPIAFCHDLSQVQLALFAHGAAVPLVVVSRTVLIQRTAPPEIQGRVFALVNMALFGMSALSSLLTGWAAEWIPASTIVLACGLLGVLPGLAGLRLPALRTAT